MQILGHTNVAFINNYSTLSEERHKKISNILTNTESETNRNAFQQTYLVKPPQILQPVQSGSHAQIPYLQQCKVKSRNQGT